MIEPAISYNEFFDNCSKCDSKKEIAALFDTYKCIYIDNYQSKLNCIYSADTRRVISYSWLQLDLEEYICNKDNNHYFLCKRFGHIYIPDKYLNYILEASLKLKVYETAYIIKLAINNRGYAKHEQGKIQAS